jgi:hypothetical protein
MDTITSKDETATPRVIYNPVGLATSTPSDGDLFCKPNPEVIFAKGEFHMTAESFESEPEPELAYWKCRVANLEIVVCELLVKNERLRRELQNVSLSAL